MNLQALIMDTKPGIRIRQLKHRLTFKNVNHLMSNALGRYKECKDKKPANRIRHEISMLKRYWGCFPLHYYRYDLYRRDKELPEQEMLDYIPEFFFYNLFLPTYDSDKYKILLEEKNITEQMFRSLGIDQPKTVMKLVGGRILSPGLEETSVRKIRNSLITAACDKIFVKPVEGKGGYGIHVFHRDTSGEFLKRDGTVFDESFIETLSGRDYIVQEGIKQHNSLNAVYPESVNTFRIATENMNGRTRIVCAVLRIGRGRNEVDNACQGGIILKIDPASGATGDYGITELGEKFLKHPDTGLLFKDFKLAHWSRIRSFVVESAMKLPNFTYLGWDIADSADGPVAIEVNLGFGLDLFQVALGGLRERFRIENPAQYYKKRR